MFLKSNMQPIISRGRIHFEFVVVDQSKISEVKKKGIFRLPAMQLESTTYVSPSDIIDALSKKMRQNRAPIQAKSEDEVVGEYMSSIVTQGMIRGENGELKIPIGGFGDEREASYEQETIPDLQNRLMEEQKKRGIAAATATYDEVPQIGNQPSKRAVKASVPPPVTRASNINHNAGFENPADYDMLMDKIGLQEDDLDFGP